jgi:hypothetical protein
MTTGIYTFAAPDASAALLMAYTYAPTGVGTGHTITLNNHLLGYTPAFKATFYQQISPGPPGVGSGTVPMSLRLNACTASKFGIPTRLDDFTITEFDFAAFAAANGIVGYLSTVE